MNPDNKEIQFWLQIGRFCVTAVVTLILTLVFAWGFLVKNIDNQVFTQAVGMVLAFWFGAASVGSMKTDTPTSTTKTIDTDPSGAKREVTMTATPGTAAPTPPVTSPLPKNGV